MGGSYVRVRRPEKSETGRPEGLPHTAAIKRNGGKFCHSCHLAVFHLLQGCETLSPIQVSDGRTLGVDLQRCNRPVGHQMTPVARELAPVRRLCRRKTGHCDGSEEMSCKGSGPLRSPAGASSLATNGQVLQIFQTSRLNVRRMAGCYHRNCLPISTRLLRLVVAVS
jgi:hypothetical protein